jgi:hypothetical protein
MSVLFHSIIRDAPGSAPVQSNSALKYKSLESRTRSVAFGRPPQINVLSNVESMVI